LLTLFPLPEFFLVDKLKSYANSLLYNIERDSVTRFSTSGFFMNQFLLSL
jgi:hypothetical protein